MSRREDIDNAIWSDPDFEALSADATLLYLWSFTNPRCGMGGIYKVSKRTMTESKVPLERIDSTLAELAASNFAFYEGQLLWVRARIKHLRPRSQQMAKSVSNDVAKVPIDDPLRARLLETYAADPWLREVLANLTRTSRDVHESPHREGESVNVTGTSAEVHPNLHGNGNGHGKERGVRGETDALPVDLPEALHDAARGVHARLLRLAEAKPGSTSPTLAATGRAVAAYPDRDHVDVADDVEHYWTFGAGQHQRMRDVVATYRNRLKTAPVITAGAGRHPGRSAAPLGADIAAAAARWQEQHA